MTAPGKFPPNSEESNKFNHQNFDPGNEFGNDLSQHLTAHFKSYSQIHVLAITMGYWSNLNNGNFEDFSHEGPQDEGRHYNFLSKNKTASTPSYLSPIGATTENALSGTQVSLDSKQITIILLQLIRR